MLIGITGGSGSGKSLVSEQFRKAGVPVIDADAAAREVTLPGKPALLKIAAVFGSEYISSDGSLIRKKLGSYVFSNASALNTLNKIIRFYILEEIDNQIAGCCAPIIGLDAPLLIEYDIDKRCDYVIAVIADEHIRSSRIQKRDNLTLADASNRIKSQNKDKFYLEKADFIVYNNSTKENLEKNVQKIIHQLREML